MARKRAPNVKKVSIQVRVPKKDRDQFHEMAESEHKDLSDIIRDFLYSRLETKKQGASV